MSHKTTSNCSCGKSSNHHVRNWHKWGRAACIRAGRTFCQTGVALLPVAVTITEVNWLAVIVTCTLAAIASLLTSLPGIPEEDMNIDSSEPEDRDDG